MNEVAQPLIFPKGELEERYRFRKLLPRFHLDYCIILA